MLRQEIINSYKFKFLYSHLVLRLIKIASGLRSLLQTVMKALLQVGNLGLLLGVLFFIYAILGVELFGKLSK